MKKKKQFSQSLRVSRNTGKDQKQNCSPISTQCTVPLVEEVAPSLWCQLKLYGQQPDSKPTHNCNTKF